MRSSRCSYGVEIPSGLDQLIFTWGNTDVGAATVDHVMCRALVVKPFLLRQFGMRACLAHLLHGFPPNLYGLT